MTRCSKPGCAGAGAAVLTYSYAGRLIVLEDCTQDALSPHAYAICPPCADRLTAPLGWSLADRRSPLFKGDLVRQA